MTSRSYPSLPVTCRRPWSEADKLSRLYVVESYHSVTGSNADHRFRVRSSELGDVVMALAGELATKHNIGIDGDFSPAVSVSAKLQSNGKNWLPILAKDLAANAGKCALVVGPRLPVHVQAVLHALNHALGNTGQTDDEESVTPVDQAGDDASEYDSDSAANGNTEEIDAQSTGALIGWKIV